MIQIKDYLKDYDNTIAINNLLIQNVQSSKQLKEIQNEYNTMPAFRKIKEDHNTFFRGMAFGILEQILTTVSQEKANDWIKKQRDIVKSKEFFNDFFNKEEIINCFKKLRQNTNEDIFEQLYQEFNKFLQQIITLNNGKEDKYDLLQFLEAYYNKNPYIDVAFNLFLRKLLIDHFKDENLFKQLISYQKQIEYHEICSLLCQKLEIQMNLFQISLHNQKEMNKEEFGNKNLQLTTLNMYKQKGTFFIFYSIEFSQKYFKQILDKQQEEIFQSQALSQQQLLEQQFGLDLSKPLFEFKGNTELYESFHLEEEEKDPDLNVDEVIDYKDLLKDALQAKQPSTEINFEGQQNMNLISQFTQYGVQNSALVSISQIFPVNADKEKEKKQLLNTLQQYQNINEDSFQQIIKSIHVTQNFVEQNKAHVYSIFVPLHEQQQQGSQLKNIPMISQKELQEIKKLEKIDEEKKLNSSVEIIPSQSQKIYQKDQQKLSSSLKSENMIQQNQLNISYGKNQLDLNKIPEQEKQMVQQKINLQLQLEFFKKVKDQVTKQSMTNNQQGLKVISQKQEQQKCEKCQKCQKQNIHMIKIKLCNHIQCIDHIIEKFITQINNLEINQQMNFLNELQKNKEIKIWCSICSNMFSIQETGAYAQQIQSLKDLLLKTLIQIIKKYQDNQEAILIQENKKKQQQKQQYTNQKAKTNFQIQCQKCHDWVNNNFYLIKMNCNHLICKNCFEISMNNKDYQYNCLCLICKQIIIQAEEYSLEINGELYKTILIFKLQEKSQKCSNIKCKNVFQLIEDVYYCSKCMIKICKQHFSEGFQKNCNCICKAHNCFLYLQYNQQLFAFACPRHVKKYIQTCNNCGKELNCIGALGSTSKLKQCLCIRCQNCQSFSSNQQKNTTDNFAIVKYICKQCIQSY